MSFRKSKIEGASAWNNKLQGAAVCAPDAGSAWPRAPEAYDETRIRIFFTKGDALKNSGIRIPVSSGITNDRTGAWACEKCKFVLIDCNG